MKDCEACERRNGAHAPVYRVRRAGPHQAELLRREGGLVSSRSPTAG